MDIKKEKILKLFKDYKVMQVGEFMATSKAYFFAPFTFNHGINRMVSEPKVMKYIIRQLVNIIKTKRLKPDLLGGVATAGISLAAVLSQETKIPFVYIRSQSEYVGLKMSAIDGDWAKAQKIILVDNIIGKGRNTMNTCKQVIREGLNIRDILVIANWESAKVSWFKKKGIKFHSLITLEEVVEYLCKVNYMPKKLQSMLLGYVYQPEPWIINSQQVKDYKKTLKKLRPVLIKKEIYTKG